MDSQSKFQLVFFKAAARGNSDLRGKYQQREEILSGLRGKYSPTKARERKYQQ